MSNRVTIGKLKLNQLDRRVSKLKEWGGTYTPATGWIKEIRKTLGISARQLAAKVGITQGALAKIEKGEVEKTVSLKTLDKIAEALDCKLAYAFIPRDSFEELVQTRAKKTAEKIVGRVSHSMDLEKQGVSKREREDQVKSMADEMARDISKEIWEDWE